MLLPNSLYCMIMALYSETDIGAVCAEGNDLSDKQTRLEIGDNVPRTEGNEKKLWVSGSAMIIRNTVWNKTGVLDNRFSLTEFEYYDYSLRILENGYKNILCHNCRVFCYENKKYEDVDYIELYDENCKRINEKWGFNVTYFSHSREELIRMIEAKHSDHDDAFTVLECGCGLGATILSINYLYPNSRVYGIEIDEKVAKLGGVGCEIYQGNIEEISFDELIKEKVDYLIFGDVLEHLKDPYSVLRKSASILKEDGLIIASLPNIMHYSVMIPLLKGIFNLKKRGYGIICICIILQKKISAQCLKNVDMQLKRCLML